MRNHRYTALLAASLASVTSSALAQSVEGNSCLVLSLSEREPPMGKAAIAHLWGTVQYFVDPRVDVSNPQTAKEQAENQVSELNNRAGHLSSEVAAKRKMYGGIEQLTPKSALAEEREKIQKALTSLSLEIAEDENNLRRHNLTNVYYIHAYCKDDVDKGYDLGNYRPRLLGRAVRDTSGRFQFRPGEQ